MSPELFVNPSKASYASDRYMAVVSVFYLLTRKCTAIKKINTIQDEAQYEKAKTELLQSTFYELWHGPTGSVEQEAKTAFMNFFGKGLHFDPAKRYQTWNTNSGNPGDMHTDWKKLEIALWHKPFTWTPGPEITDYMAPRQIQ
jgi:hypothetical protein